MERKTTLVLVAALTICIVGFTIDMMDIDASQYAEISREMMNTGSYLKVYELGQDYLDKPPLLFWLSAISMKIFGANNFGYRFPSFLFSLLALLSTYRLAFIFYKKDIALLSVMVLASCQAFFLMNHDVRTDTMLMGCVIFSLWQLAEWFSTKKVLNFVAGFVGIGLGMLAKGPIALMIPIFAFGTHFLLRRNYKSIFKAEYILGLIIIAIILLPMCIGLYTQFDAQKEKGISGLRFYFWVQSFGRITGENTWNNNKNIFFLLQNMLWSYLPWIFIFLAACWFEFKTLFAQRLKLEAHQEWISMGGFFVSYLALGSSKYQLPHYIFVVLPLASIVTAKFVYKLEFEKLYPRLLRFFEKSHLVIFSLLWIALLILLIYIFTTPWWVITLAIVNLGLFIMQFYRKNKRLYLINLCVFSMISINLFLNLSIYPSLLQYQAGSNIGRWLKKQEHVPENKVFIFQDRIWHSLHFYSGKIITIKDDPEDLVKGDYLILKAEKLASIRSGNRPFKIIYKTPTYKVSTLKFAFINPETRSQETALYVIIKML